MERRAQHQQTKVNKTKQATRQEEIILTRLQTGHTRFNKTLSVWRSPHYPMSITSPYCLSPSR